MAMSFNEKLIELLKMDARFSANLKTALRRLRAQPGKAETAAGGTAYQKPALCESIRDR